MFATVEELRAYLRENQLLLVQRAEDNLRACRHAGPPTGSVLENTIYDLFQQDSFTLALLPDLLKGDAVEELLEATSGQDQEVEDLLFNVWITAAQMQGRPALANELYRTKTEGL